MKSDWLARGSDFKQPSNFIHSILPKGGGIFRLEILFPSKKWKAYFETLVLYLCMGTG